MCSKRFAETCYILSVLEGIGPSRQTLKLDAVPTMFGFSSPPKCRRFSEVRQAKAQHMDVMKQLLENTSDNARIYRACT